MSDVRTDLMNDMPMNDTATNGIAMAFPSASALFPPLKKGGRGDLLLSPEQSRSPFIPFLQRGKKTFRSSAT